MLGTGNAISQTALYSGQRALPLFGAVAGSLYALFGVGNLLAGYTGPFERWRRATDNDQQDVWWDGSTVRLGGGEVVTGWLAGGNAYQVTRYDHTRQGHDATQATASAQPRTALAGVVDVGPNGKPVAVFSGAQFLEVQNALGFSRLAAALTVAANIKATGAGTQFVFTTQVAASTSTRATFAYIGGSTTISVQGRQQDGYALTTASTTVTSLEWARLIARARYAGGYMDIAANGAALTSVSMLGFSGAPSNTPDTDSFSPPRIGASASGASFLTGQIGTLALARTALDPTLTDAALLKTAA